MHNRTKGRLFGIGHACLLAIGLGISGSASAQIVVLGHAQSGKTVVVVGRQNAEGLAWKQAQEKVDDSGWRVLLISSKLGRGAMFCIRTNGKTHFFVEDSSLDGAAISKARRRAYEAAPKGETPYICGTWNNHNEHTDADKPRLLIRDYSGVTVRYTYGTVRSGRVVAHAKATNHRAGHVAVSFSIAGASPRVVTLEPGGSVSLALGSVASFSVDISDVSEAQPPVNNHPIETLKGVVRDLLEVSEEGNLRTVTSVGVRG